MASPPQEPQRGMPRTPRALWGWWLVLLALLVWNAVTFFPALRPEVSIPYATLLAQVRTGNVATVRIVGEAIRGSFVKPVPWPPPTPAGPPSPASGAPAPQPPNQPAAASPATYTAFTTTFPQAIGDSTLLPLLEAQRVLVDVAPPPTHWLAYVLTEATRLARRMVTRWGMGELGLVAFQADAEHPFLGYELAQGHDYSEATAARIDEDIQRLLAERHAYTRRLLTDAREPLHQLAQALLQEETLGQEALVSLLGPRPATVAEKPD
jgi:hypothetical protein